MTLSEPRMTDIPVAIDQAPNQENHPSAMNDSAESRMLSIDDLGRKFLINRKRASKPGRVFPEYQESISDLLVSLWKKYQHELHTLSEHLSRKYKEMTKSGLGAVFGDREGELLYIIIRETRPGVVHEISPNSGYSTNYLLSALTANNYGVLHSFEIAQRFNGEDAEKVIRRNLIDTCDKDRWALVSGDARLTVFEKLQYQEPDFTLVDSCHDDFFSEFYIKELLPRLSGWVAIQDAAHFDPRAEGAGEAKYLLSYLQKTASDYLLLGLYDDDLNDLNAEKGIVPRREIRSNTILLQTGPRQIPLDVKSRLPNILRGEVPLSEAAAEFPLNASEEFGADLTNFRSSEEKPEDDYVEAIHSPSASTSLMWYCDFVAISEHRKPFNDEAITDIVDRTDKLDAESIVLLCEALARGGFDAGVLSCSKALKDAGYRGCMLPMRMAQACQLIDLEDEAVDWLERTRSASGDPLIAVNYRILMQAAVVALRLGRAKQAKELFAEGIELIANGEPSGRIKASREAFLAALRHLTFLPVIIRSSSFRRQSSASIDARQLPFAIGVAFAVTFKKIRGRIMRTSPS